MNYIDENIEYDIDKLPEILKDTIHELEDFDNKKDLIMYEGTLKALEGLLKNATNSGFITLGEYKLLMKKYGGEL